MAFIFYEWTEKKSYAEPRRQFHKSTFSLIAFVSFFSFLLIRFNFFFFHPQLRLSLYLFSSLQSSPAMQIPFSTLINKLYLMFTAVDLRSFKHLHYQNLWSASSSETIIIFNSDFAMISILTIYMPLHPIIYHQLFL